MAKGAYDAFITSIEGLIAGLEEARDKAAPAAHDAVVKWAENTARDARMILSRPSWLLPSSIESKVVDYKKDRKIWAMAAFRFREKNNKRDPGFYGQYHEAGWAPDRKVVKVPDHFLRQAKKKNMPTLLKELDEALEEVTGIIKQKFDEKLHGA